MAEEMELIQKKINTLQLEMEKPDLCRKKFDELYKTINDLKYQKQYLDAKLRGQERQKTEEEELQMKLEEERLEKLKGVYKEELKKNTEGWEKVINQTVKQINSTKKLHEQLLDAIPNVRHNFSTYFFPENIYKWVLLALASRDGVGTFLKVSNRMTYPPIHRKISMSEHYPIESQMNGEDHEPN